MAVELSQSTSTAMSTMEANSRSSEDPLQRDIIESTGYNRNNLSDAALASFRSLDFDNAVMFLGKILHITAETLLVSGDGRLSKPVLSEDEHCVLYYSCLELRVDYCRRNCSTVVISHRFARLQWLQSIIQVYDNFTTVSSEEKALLKCIQGDLLADGIQFIQTSPDLEKKRPDEAADLTELRRQAKMTICEALEKVRSSHKLYVDAVYLTVHYCYARHAWTSWGNAEEGRMAIWLATCSFRRNGVEVLEARGPLQSWTFKVLRRLIQYDALLLRRALLRANDHGLTALPLGSEDVIHHGVWVRGHWVRKRSLT